MAQAQKKQTITKANLQALGVGLAVAIFEAEKHSDDVKQATLIKLAREHSHNPESVTAILEGYQTKMKEFNYSDSIIKVRKSEAKAVFDACGKTEVSEFNQKTLENFKGGYHAFIDKARELRGIKERTSGERTRNKLELTEKQEKAMEENIGKANVTQLVDIADTAISQIHKNAPAPLAGFQTLLAIQTMAGQLVKNDKVDKFFNKAAQAVLDIVEPAIAQAQKALQETKKAEEAMKQGTAAQVLETAVEKQA